MAVNGRLAIKKAEQKTTNELMDREVKLRRSFTRHGLSMKGTVELAAIRQVLTDRQVVLKPLPGLPALR